MRFESTSTSIGNVLFFPVKYCFLELHTVPVGYLLICIYKLGCIHLGRTSADVILRKKYEKREEKNEKVKQLGGKTKDKGGIDV